MTRVLVTGAAGNVGQAVVRHLLKDSRYEVVATDQREFPDWISKRCETSVGDLRDPELARRVLRGSGHVIHLAAIVGGIGNFNTLPYTLSEVNSALCNAIVAAAVGLGVERFVYVSSSMVFENATVFPTPEDYLPACPTPTSAYGFSKLAGEVLSRAANDEHGLPFTIVRPGNAYGPGELPGDMPGRKHVVPDLIGKVLSGQKPVQVLGSGHQTRTLTHLDDTAEGIVTAMTHPAGLNDDFNITGSEEVTIAELARIVWEACGKDPEEFALEPVQQPFRVDVQRRILANEKAKRVLQWEPKIVLRDGIKATADWMAQQMVQR